jgi:hypothetical protein
VPRGSLSRRSLFGRSALAGGAALAVARGSAGTQAVAAEAPATVTPPAGLRPFAASDMNFEALFALGETAYGAGEIGEVLATVNAINAAGASYQTFYDGFINAARTVGKIAADASAAGYRASARSAYLRSAQYYDQALFFVLGTSTPQAEESVYQRMQQQWNAAAQLFDPPFQPVRIPYEQTTMPGYFLATKRGGRRPTVIVMNGSDAQNVDVYAFGGAAAIERGWNALIFEGPGQGSMLFERKIPFRPDWEKVITPIVDFLHARPDVDTTRIALTGWSLGGALVTRAAAFEKRLAAVCADPGFVATWDAYPASLRNMFAHGATESQVNAIWQHDVIPALSPQDRFALAKRSEIYGPQYLDTARAGQVFTDLWSFGQTVMQYQVADVAARVTAPMLVTQYEHDQFFPTGGQQLYDLLTCPKTLVTFTAAEGAAYHDAPLAPQRRNQVVFDWLDATLKVRD